MNILVTTSNELYRKSRDFNAKCALKFGKFDRVIIYDNDKDIDSKFRKKNQEILTIKIGAGLWLWKIYFIHKALMEECNDGDILFYLDAAGFFFRNVAPLIAAMKDDIFAVALPYIEEEFTKSETFVLMGMDQEEFKKSNQYQASYMAFRKSERRVSFVKEWLNYGQNINVISPFHSIAKQIDSFYGHRMDQSIFSLLCKKYKVKTHFEITQFALYGYPYYEDVTYIIPSVKKEYPIFVYLHRTKNFPSFLDIFRVIENFYHYRKTQKRYLKKINRNLHNE